MIAIATAYRAQSALRATPAFARRRTLVRLRRLRRAYWDYQIRRATNAALRKLDDRTLADIGIDRGEVEAFVGGGGKGGLSSKQ